MDLGEKLSKMYPSLERFAFSLTGCKEDAEDITMESITKILEKKEKLSFDINIEAYLIRTIKNTFVDLVRKNNKINKNDEIDNNDENLWSAKDFSTRNVESDEIGRAFAKIGDSCKETISLFL